MSETGTCEMCDSEISLNADRCPECGYEPGGGWITGILGGLSVAAIVLLGGITLITWVVVIGGTLAVDTALTVTAFFGFLALFPVGFLYLGVRFETTSPTGDD